MGAIPSGAQKEVECKTVIFPTSPARVPPPRNQTSKLEKTTVGAKITGFGVSWGKSVVTTS